MSAPTQEEREKNREEYWRGLLKRYLFLIIQEESTIYDTQIQASPLFTESELITIRKLADDAEDEFGS